MILRNFLFAYIHSGLARGFRPDLATQNKKLKMMMQQKNFFYIKKNFFLEEQKCNDAKLVLQIAWLQKFEGNMSFFVQATKYQYSHGVWEEKLIFLCY